MSRLIQLFADNNLYAYPDCFILLICSLLSMLIYRIQQNTLLANNSKRASDDVDRQSDFLDKAEAYAKTLVTLYHKNYDDIPIYSSLLENLNASLKEARAGGLPGHMLETCVQENFPACFLGASRSSTTKSFQYSSLARYVVVYQPFQPDPLVSPACRLSIYVYFLYTSRPPSLYMHICQIKYRRV
jgi:hypothetical protein